MHSLLQDEGEKGEEIEILTDILVWLWTLFTWCKLLTSIFFTHYQINDHQKYTWLAFKNLLESNIVLNVPCSLHSSALLEKTYVHSNSYISINNSFAYGRNTEAWKCNFGDAFVVNPGMGVRDYLWIYVQSCHHFRQNLERSLEFLSE